MGKEAIAKVQGGKGPEYLWSNGDVMGKVDFRKDRVLDLLDVSGGRGKCRGCFCIQDWAHRLVEMPVICHQKHRSTVNSDGMIIDLKIRLQFQY